MLYIFAISIQYTITYLSLSRSKPAKIWRYLAFSAFAMSYTTCLFFFFVLATSPVESRRRQDPCKGYKHSDFQYKLPDPYNCKKFWMCSVVPRGNHFTCPPGTSFDPDSKVGSCTGPPPVLVNKGFRFEKYRWKIKLRIFFREMAKLDNLERVLKYLRTRIQDKK